MIENTDGLVAAYIFDRAGGEELVGWSQVRRWTPAEGFLWVHLDYTGADAQSWIENESGLDRIGADFLLSEETRPRSAMTGGKLMVSLRGANSNPEADPDDMVAIRIVLDEHRVITTRHRRLHVIGDIRAALAADDESMTPSRFLVEVANGLTTRMAEVVDELETSVDDLEDEVLASGSYDTRPKIAAFRRRATGLRRYLSPQRDALLRLHTERVSWLRDIDRAHIREIADRTTRLVEDLESIREHAVITQDELDSRLSEQMNRTMYILSIITAIFLPLGLLTGLLGINVGGMPGVDNPWAFGIVCGILVVAAIVQFFIFRRRHWI